MRAPVSARTPATPIPPPTASQPRASTLPGSYRPTSDVAARRAEIESRARSIDAEDYFQMLGVGADATHEQIQTAYFALAKAWHPDRQPPELVELKAQVSRVFTRFNEAYQTLTDQVKRGDYTRLYKQGGGTPDEQQKVARVVDAALEFQKAEILLRKHDLVGAEMLAKSAVKADPEQPEYLTLLVWIQAQRRGEAHRISEGQTTTQFDDLIKQLDGVLAKEPRYERALFYRGMLLKRAGRIDKALRDFRLSAEINPKNLDAVREVRLHEMRRRVGGQATERPGARTPSKTPPTPTGGLLGKLFKK
jgi:curved DNA-binding protein CbpA